MFLELDGWTLEPRMVAAEEYYDLRIAYPTNDDGLKHNRRSKSPPPGRLPIAVDPQVVDQNETWDNDRKMMQALLGNSNTNQLCDIFKVKWHADKECPNK